MNEMGGIGYWLSVVLSYTVGGLAGNALGIVWGLSEDCLGMVYRTSVP